MQNEKEESFILNKKLSETEIHSKINGYGHVHMKAAQNRYMRFMPFLAKAFPETAARKGIIESELYDISDFSAEINKNFKGKLFLKDDAHLPVGKSVTARGAMHEVLHIAEILLQKNKLLSPTENYSKLNSAEIKDFLSHYKIYAVERENLALSAGILAARLGFKTVIYLSQTENQEKKNNLLNEEIEAKEYKSDYRTAVSEAQKDCEKEENSFFVGKSDSEDYFFGCSSAALRLKVQLNKAHVEADENHPLFVYIPALIPEAAIGIAFGLKQLMGKDVHCFLTQSNDLMSPNETSEFLKSISENIISGVFTVSDESMLNYSNKLKLSKNINLKPTACTGFKAIENFEYKDFQSYLKKYNLLDKLENSAHIIWAAYGNADLTV